MSKSEGRNGEKKAVSTKDLPPKSKGCFKFDLDKEDFEDFKLRYVPPNWRCLGGYCHVGTLLPAVQLPLMYDVIM